MFTTFMDESNYIDDGLVYSDGKAIGLLAPSTLIGFDESNEMQLCGRKGIAKMEGKNKTSFWAALVDSDCIIFGDDIALKKCRALLKQPAYSRTVAYLSTISTNCEDLLSRFDAIRSSRLLVLGCGGIGSMTALNLAGAGVGSITLVDHDTVELSNLNRQFFWTQNDAGRVKAEVLSKIIAERYPHVSTSIHAKKMSVEDVVMLGDAYDAIGVTADEPLGIGQEIASKSKVFVAYGAYFQGFLGFFAWKQEEQSFPCNKSIKWIRNPYFIGPSFGPGNTELAGVISSVCIHYLCCRGSLPNVNLSSVWKGDRVAANGERRHYS